MAFPIIGGIGKLFKKKTKPEDYPDELIPMWSVFGDLIASYEDPTYQLSPHAYATMRRNDVVLQPMSKLAERIGSMQLTVVGSGKRRDELQKIVDQSIAVSDALEWLAWARIEGVRFMWCRSHLDEESEMSVGDFRGCGRVKWKAAGAGYTPYYWTGWQDDRVFKMPEFATSAVPKHQLTAEGKEFDRKQIVVFRPGAGNNPEGETELSVQIYLLAEMAQLLDKYMRIYADRFAIPREILKKMIDMIRPDEASSVVSAAAAKIKLANSRQRMAASTTDMLEFVEPTGTTWGFLTEFRGILERRVHRLITGEDQSSGGQGASGERGGHEGSEKQLNASAVAFGKKIVDALTTDWLPFIEKVNDSRLPKLKKSEPRPYLSLRPPVEKQRPTVAEMVQVLDRNVALPTDFIYEVIGCDRPEGLKDVFKLSEDGMIQASPLGQPGEQPTEGGGAEQRKDREVPGSGIPDENTRPQDKNEDLRNVKPASE